jgi:hypothetical protein
MIKSDSIVFFASAVNLPLILSRSYFGAETLDKYGYLEGDVCTVYIAKLLDFTLVVQPSTLLLLIFYQ